VIPLNKTALAVVLLLFLIPFASAEDSDGDGYENPTENFTIWDGADAFPNNPDIHDPVFSTGCDPPVATLDLGEPVIFTCTIGNEGPIDVDVFIELGEYSNLINQFEAKNLSINSNQIVEFQVKVSGLSEGVATAKLSIYARANGSAGHMIDLPIEVTGEEWAGLSSQSNVGGNPDISFINRALDDTAAWLSDNTPWQFSRMNAGIVVLFIGLGLIASIRKYRARKLWTQNMEKKTESDRQTEARFDQIRRSDKHQHHIEPTIPESPKFIIKSKK
jgi:hypothetical protein